MSEFFLSYGREDDWSVSPVPGELIFRTCNSYMRSNDGSKPKDRPEYEWELSVVKRADGFSWVFGKLAVFDTIRDGVIIVRPAIEGGERTESEKFLKYNGDNPNKPNYFRASELGVYRFMNLMPNYFNLTEGNLKWKYNLFKGWIDQIFIFNFLPETRKIMEKSCDMVSRKCF